MDDVSTQLAALRTAKIDRIRVVDWESAESLINSNPELKYQKMLEASVHWVGMRTDLKPFNDVRVRQALMMAIDFKTMAKDLYKGNAEILSFPTAPTAEMKGRGIYIPLEQLPADIQNLYTYHPDKAKQVLAEAGYPDGFKAELICLSDEVDPLSVYKNYWAKIGADVEIKPTDSSVQEATVLNKGFKGMITTTAGWSYPFLMRPYRPGQLTNISLLDDPRTMELYNKLGENFFNEAEKNRLFREWVPYCLSQAWYIQLVHQYTYTFWQPWLKNFHGEWSVGLSNMENWIRWAWVDQELKQQMTGGK